MKAIRVESDNVRFKNQKERLEPYKKPTGVGLEKSTKAQKEHQNARDFFSSPPVIAEEQKAITVCAPFVFAKIEKKSGSNYTSVRYDHNVSGIYDSLDRDPENTSRSLPGALESYQAKNIKFFYKIPNRKDIHSIGSIKDLMLISHKSTVIADLLFSATNFEQSSGRLEAKAIIFASFHLGFFLKKDPKAAEYVVSDLSKEDFTTAMTNGLSIAAWGYPASFARFFLEKGADPDPSRFSSRENYPLTLAIKGENTEVIRVLMDAGANPFHKLFSLDTPPIEYAEEGSIVYSLLTSTHKKAS